MIPHIFLEFSKLKNLATNDSKGSQNLVPGGPQLGGGWHLGTHLETCYVVLGVTKTRLDIIFGGYTSECDRKTTKFFRVTEANLMSQNDQSWFSGQNFILSERERNDW